jgi:hypothetical protein
MAIYKIPNRTNKLPVFVGLSIELVCDFVFEVWNLFGI